MSWLHPSVLSLAALALAPILLHLWLRERVRKIAFSALRFLQKQNQELFMRKRWLEWLLAALRVTCVLLAVVAFARPFVRPPAPTGPAAGRATIVMLDVSRSMTAGTKFAEARQQARKIIEAAPEHDALTLVTFADAGNVAVVPAASRGAILDALAQVQPTGGGTDIIAAVERTLPLAQAAAGEVHLISDLQDSGLSGSRELPHLPRGFSLTVHRVGAAAGADGAVAVQGGAFTDNITPADRNFSVSVRFLNTGKARVADARLIVNGQTLDQRKLSLPQDGQAAVTLTGTLRQADTYSGLVQLSDVPTALPGDDRFYFVVRVVSRVRVAVVDGTPEAAKTDRTRDAAYFLVQALSAGADSPYAAQACAALPPLDGYQVVILAGVPALGEKDAQRLRDFVRAGGGLLVGLSPDIQPEAFNRSLGVLAAGKLRGWRREDSARFLVPADPTHTLVTRLVTEGKSDLGAPRLTQTADLKDTQDAHVILRFDDRRPALLEQAVGKGRVILFAGALDRRGGDFPLRPLFLPFVQEVMRLLVAQGADAHALLTGETLPVPAGAAVTTPDGRRAPAGAQGESAPLTDPGIYRVAAGGVTTLAAVNSDPKESDPAAADPADVEKMFAPVPDAVLRASSSGVERVLAPDELLAAERRGNIGFWCLGALVLLTLAELGLAQYASRQ
jgi:hypothetical protein